MGKISRRNFLNNSLFIASSAFLFPSLYLRSKDLSFSEEQAHSKAYPSFLELERKGVLRERVEKLYSYYENGRH